MASRVKGLAAQIQPGLYSKTLFQKTKTNQITIIKPHQSTAFTGLKFKQLWHEVRFRVYTRETRE